MPHGPLRTHRTSHGDWRVEAVSPKGYASTVATGIPSKGLADYIAAAIASGPDLVDEVKLLRDEVLRDARGEPARFVPDTNGGHIEFNGQTWRPAAT